VRDVGVAVGREVQRLAVQFRGMGVPEAEITVSGEVREVADGVASIDTRAVQNGKAIIRNAEARVRLPTIQG